MSKRIAGLVAFGWTLTFCAAPSPPAAVVTPAASSSAPLAVREAHAAPPPPPAPAVDPQLAKERLDAAKQVIAYMNAQAASMLATATIDEAALWRERLFRAQEDVLTGQALVDAARDRVSELRKLEAQTQQRVNQGHATSAELSRATYYRASAEIDLARLAH